MPEILSDLRVDFLLPHKGSVPALPYLFKANNYPLSMVKS